MKLDAKLMNDAIVLSHVNKVGGEMKEDLNKILSKKNLTVDAMLNMTAKDYMANANEVMGTGQDGFGQQFVEEVVLAKELIDRLETNGSLLVDATIKLMEGKSVDFPVKGAKRRMVLTAEKTGAPTGGASNAAQVKKLQTPKITLTAKEMKITIYYSDTFEEDSVLAIAEYILGEITAAYEASVHQILINGDVATSGNINGVVADLEDGADTDVLAADGIRKIAISGSKVVDAGGNLAIENLRSARGLMGVKGLDPSKLRLVPDVDTYFELMNLTEVQTIEKFGDAATIKDGILVALDGMKIVMREEMSKALATGLIDATDDANNTFGAIAIVHTPSVNVGIRRGLTTELSRYAEDGVTGVTGTARVAVTLDNTQNNKRATSAAALIRNI